MQNAAGLPEAMNFLLLFSHASQKFPLSFIHLSILFFADSKIIPTFAPLNLNRLIIIN
jgi:hypothetical protein